MAIRLMYQNVNKFGIDRFFNQSRKRKRDGGIGGLRQCDAALDRLTVLLNTITGANPDLISIVEVNRGQNGIALGNLVTDDSAAGLMDRINALGLLNSLGAARNYKLVPPIVTGTGGRAEGVAVFYDMTVLQFLGPWAWPAGGQGPADTAVNIAGAGGAVGVYPPTWSDLANPANDCLPNRVIGLGLPNAGLNENTLAAQWQYVDALGNLVEFPLAGYRRAILTVFREMNAPNRILKLVSMHAPPDQLNPPPPPLAQVASILGTAAVADIPDIIGAIPPDDVWAICGDFNVSLYWALLGPLAYGPITAAGFTQEISLGAAPAIPDTYPSKNYVITHNMSSDNATPWLTNGYPGFGYLSVPDGFGRYDAIDNIFTRYGLNAQLGAPNTTILNTVSGSPYTAAPPPAPPPVIPQGVVAVPTQLNNPASLNSPVGRVVNAPGALISFGAWANYRKIRSTSDHFAIGIDL